MVLKLSDVEIDALKEIGNVGVGNAATSLSRMLDKKISIDLPDTNFVELSKFSELIGGPERIVVSLYLTLSGDVKGECVFLFPKEGAFEIIDLMMGQKKGTTNKFTDMEESAFKEMSNIFVGSYISSLANMLNLKIFPSVPNVGVDMAQALVDFMLIKLSKAADQFLCVKTDIDIEGHDINGQFMMIFEDASLKKIIKALKKKYGDIL